MATAHEQQYIDKYVKKLLQLTLTSKILFRIGRNTRHWSFYLQVILLSIFCLFWCSPLVISVLCFRYKNRVERHKIFSKVIFSMKLTHTFPTYVAHNISKKEENSSSQFWFMSNFSSRCTSRNKFISPSVKQISKNYDNSLTLRSWKIFDCQVDRNQKSFRPKMKRYKIMFTIVYYSIVLLPSHLKCKRD